MIMNYPSELLSHLRDRDNGWCLFTVFPPASIWPAPYRVLLDFLRVTEGNNGFF